jgi:hypothetical protein
MRKVQRATQPSNDNHSEVISKQTNRFDLLSNAKSSSTHNSVRSFKYLTKKETHQTKLLPNKPIYYFFPQNLFNSNLLFIVITFFILFFSENWFADDPAAAPQAAKKPGKKIRRRRSIAN